MYPKTDLGEIGQRLIFVADAHQNKFHQPLYELLDFLEQELAESKDFTLLLMGDLFDMLFGYVPSSITPHQNIIQRLECMASQRKIYYLEGNHDFNLKPIFKSVHVIPHEQQPAIASVGGIKIAISHGDLALDRSYQIYTKIIRNPTLLYILGHLDRMFNGKIFEIVKYILQKRRITHYDKDTKHFTEYRLSLYDTFNVKWIFEGHFHTKNAFFQKETKNYIGLPPFYCIKDTFIVEYYNDVFFIYSPIR